MRTLTFFLGAALFAAPVFAADVAGEWEATTETPRGEMKVTFHFETEGDTLTGTVSNEFLGESEIQDGKIDGDSISFKQVMERGGRKMTMLYTGEVAGDTIEFTRKVEGGPRGKGGGGRGPGGGGRPGGRGEMTFTATRAQ